MLSDSPESHALSVSLQNKTELNIHAALFGRGGYLIGNALTI
jgi:hypothetical protein